jgi:uncharacterized membrane protein
MNQDEINERERTNPANWGQPFAFYRSRLDSRLWVRKPKPWMGWSLNMAKPASKVIVALFVVALILAVVVPIVVILK